MGLRTALRRKIDANRHVRLARVLLGMPKDRLRAALRRVQQSLAHGLGLAARQDLVELEDRLARRQRELDTGIAFLSQCLGTNSGRKRADGPLVSIILPTRDRRALVGQAIDSVLAQSYCQWELLVVDDGSVDNTADFLRATYHDPRVKLLTQAQAGAAAARNRGLSQAGGEFIAYLDSDNTWFPNYLSSMVEWFEANPSRNCAYAGQLVRRSNDTQYIRAVPFDRESFEQGNFIDLNVFMHRRQCLDRHGAFDERLTRFLDWELLGRYCRDESPQLIPTIGGRYPEGRPDSITIQEEPWLNRYQAQRSAIRPVTEPLRVLYGIWHYPQITESYVRWEIECLLRWGVHVEVYAQQVETAAPFPSPVPLHTGDLREAIRKCRPDVIHVHWLNFVEQFRNDAARFGLPVTARGHGFEFSGHLLRKLQLDPVVDSLYVYPHFMHETRTQKKLVSMRCGVNGELYYPPEQKDKRMVLRAGAGLPTKDLRTFIHTAQQCPDHRFVLALGRATGEEAFTDEIAAYNESLGSPVEMRVNVAAEEMAALAREAGIYLHTFGFDAPFGMPMSIAEAMATGALVLTRWCAGSIAMLGRTGRFYSSARQAAAIIRDSLLWSDARWEQVRRQAVSRAFEHHGDLQVYLPLVKRWRELANRRVMFATPTQMLDERFQPAIEYLLKQRFDRFPHHDGSLVSHAIGVARALDSWGTSFDVCLAGMFHSIYGTERGGTGYDFARRAELKALIGERAEELVYRNCTLQRASFDAALAAGRLGFKNRITSEDVHLAPQDFDDLCRVHLADWLEQVPRCQRWTERRSSYRLMAERLGRAALACYHRVYGTYSHDDRVLGEVAPAVPLRKSA